MAEISRRYIDKYWVVPVSTLVYFHHWCHIRLPDVFERQELPLNLLSKLVSSLILEKHLVVLKYFPASLKILE